MKRKATVMIADRCWNWFAAILCEHLALRHLDCDVEIYDVDTIPDPSVFTEERVVAIIISANPDRSVSETMTVCHQWRKAFPQATIVCLVEGGPDCARVRKEGFVPFPVTDRTRVFHPLCQLLKSLRDQPPEQ